MAEQHSKNLNMKRFSITS